MASIYTQSVKSNSSNTKVNLQKKENKILKKSDTAINDHQSYDEVNYANPNSAYARTSYGCGGAYVKSIFANDNYVSKTYGSGLSYGSKVYIKTTTPTNNREKHTYGYGTGLSFGSKAYIKTTTPSNNRGKHTYGYGTGLSFGSKSNIIEKEKVVTRNNGTGIAYGTALNFGSGVKIDEQNTVATPKISAEMLDYINNSLFEVLEDDIVEIINEDDKTIITLSNGNQITIDDETENVISVYYSNYGIEYYYDDDCNIIGSSNPDATGIFTYDNHVVGQYGGAQGDFSNNIDNLAHDQKILNIFNENFSWYDAESMYAYLRKVQSTGCHYTALVNSVFEKYKGREQEFLDTFGFPMYSVNQNGTRDYNYEPLIVDIHSYYTLNEFDYDDDGYIDKYGCDTIWQAVGEANGLSADGAGACYDYLQSKYGFEGEFSSFYTDAPISEEEWASYAEEGKTVVLASNRYELFDLSGNFSLGEYGSGYSGHAMTITGFVDDPWGGRSMLVSTWGKEYILKQYNTDDNSYLFYDLIS